MRDRPQGRLAWIDLFHKAPVDPTERTLRRNDLQPTVGQVPQHLDGHTFAEMVGGVNLGAVAGFAAHQSPVLNHRTYVRWRIGGPSVSTRDQGQTAQEGGEAHDDSPQASSPRGLAFLFGWLVGG